MKSSTYRTVAALLGLGSMVVVVSGPSPRTIARTTPNLTPSARPGSAQSGTRTQAQLAEAYGKVPLSFEANRGQTDPRVKFLSRGSGYTLFLTGDEAVLSLRSQEPAFRSQKGKRPRSLVPGHLHRTRDSAQGTKGDGQGTKDVLHMKLLGANRAAKVTALNELPGKSNYFIGNDPKKWRTDVPTYAKVKYEGVYPGIDLIYYGNQRQFEYDFVVAPGSDPKAITLAVGAGLSPPDGAQQAAPLRVDATGDLVVEAEGGEVRFHKPVVYQPTASLNSQFTIFTIQNSQL